jgi:hypothetical protein
MKNYKLGLPSKKAVVLTSIYNCEGNEHKKNINAQKLAALSFCSKNNIMPIRFFHENHLGLNMERPILKSLKRFLYNNNHDISILIFPGFKIFDDDDEVILFVMELSYLNIQLLPLENKNIQNRIAD